jgi:glyoxylase-like metal-dependent hydrolase (beta-lactamase superfamily II)
MCPVGGRLVSGDPNVNARLVCHCLLIETDGGLVLVDTGFGTGDVLHPEKVGGEVRTFARPLFSIEETARRQIENLGFRVEDVRHVVPTHLDVDHASGLPDFPEATVHIFKREHDAFMSPRTFIERKRYRRHHVAHGPKWKLYEEGGEPWFGFPCVRDLEGLPPEILLVPLVGHTRGHSAVAVQTGDRWLLHAGDSYFYRGEKEPLARCPQGLAWFQRIVAVDDKQRLMNQQRLRELEANERANVTIFCAHDPVEYRSFG